MQEQVTEQLDEAAAASELWVRIGDAAQLTLGSGGGSSEDKRYVYN